MYNIRNTGFYTQLIHTFKKLLITFFYKNDQAWKIINTYKFMQYTHKYAHLSRQDKT